MSIIQAISSVIIVGQESILIKSKNAKNPYSPSRNVFMVLRSITKGVNVALHLNVPA